MFLPIKRTQEELNETDPIRRKSFQRSLSCEKDQILCVTIPYSKGWKATVNGKCTKIYKANGMFMGIVMKKEHKVSD